MPADNLPGHSQVPGLRVLMVPPDSGSNQTGPHAPWGMGFLIVIILTSIIQNFHNMYQVLNNPRVFHTLITQATNKLLVN